MRLKRFGLVLVAVGMLAAIVASGASGAAFTQPETHWTIAGTKMVSGGSETVGCEVGKHLFAATREAKLEINGSLGASKTPVKLTATALECIDSAGTLAPNGSATISQVGTMAEGAGRLRFTGVSVDEPPNCQVKGISHGGDPVGTIITEPLRSQIQEETEPTTVFEKFEPGGGGAFVEIEIAKSGALGCGVSGKYALKGTFFGETVKNVEATEKAPTRFEAVSQALTLSKEIEQTAGGTLTLGGNAASITGRIVTRLTGANKGRVWGAVE